MPDQFYIPGLPENLQGILYTPRHSQGEVKRLRQQLAGNPAAQQQLVQDDRYWQGKGMVEDSPLAAGAAFAGSIPYDLAKLAYFHSPRAVQRPIEAGTEALFPGEGFNLQTTARPSRAANSAYLQGMAEGLYGMARDKVEAVASKRMPEGVAERLRTLTHALNYNTPYLSTALMMREGDFGGPRKKGETPEQHAQRQSQEDIRRFARTSVAAHAVDPVGTSLKALNNLLQTVAPDTDTRMDFAPIMPDDRMPLRTLAPGFKPVTAMTPEAKAKQNAQISELLKSWGPAQPTQFPINMRVQVPAGG